MKKFLSNSFITHSFGLFIIVGLLLLIGGAKTTHATVINSLWIICISYLAIVNILPLISKYLLVARKHYIFPVLIAIYAIVGASIIFFRIDYSRITLILGASFTFIWLYITAILRHSHKILNLTYLDNFDVSQFESRNNIRLTKLAEPYRFSDITGSGLIADLHDNLTDEQKTFIAHCALQNIPVFHTRAIKELLEGRVQVNYFSENMIGTLLPSPMYRGIKRVWESLLIIASFPITLPIMFCTAVLIKLESKGPIFFIQERIGQGGKPFRIYKFRSMTIKEKNSEDKFATEEQARITAIGRFIRKLRIDELPQFFNVLKGEMALIGPRPEQDSFVKQFEQEIPFYIYRHIVKPGITGWAQTVQGYADDTGSTKIKLSYDLFYIKHLSFWLDVTIVFKTITTMFTGFGAK